MLSEPGAMDEAQGMQQVVAWVMRDAAAAGGGSAMLEGDGGSLPDVPESISDLDPADLAAMLEAEVLTRPRTILLPAFCSAYTVRKMCSPSKCRRSRPPTYCRQVNEESEMRGMHSYLQRALPGVSFMFTAADVSV
jgi:hypothetical protein